ncbi:DUF2501 domain-containing protein [Herbaspirillum sp. HC18]|nr:DUF2501 domain-containing protein [Herbaspirillum sp. HC18]
MKTFIRRNVVTGILVAVLLPWNAANAQLGDILKHGGSSGASSGLGSVLPGQSVTAGSTGNVVGLLEFCIKNNFLGGNDASSVKDGLMGKLGGAPASDTGYKDGAKGLLKSSDGKQFDLSGGGMKADLTKQVCDKILAQGKSLL